MAGVRRSPRAPGTGRWLALALVAAGGLLGGPAGGVEVPPSSAVPLAAAAHVGSRPIASADTEAIAGPQDATKVIAVSDGDEGADKLPLRSKVKECCGYPIGRAQDYRLTFYWLAYEAEYANEKYDTAIYTADGLLIGRYPNAFVWELNMEGSGILRDGRVLNYDGKCRYGVGICFKTLEPAEHPLGRGVQARSLEPFRSIAVDPRFIPIGSPVYVPELVGVAMPDGTRHDGCLRADDQGGAIKLHKMDFFVESYFNFKFIAEQLWWRLKATPHLDEPRCEYLRLRASHEHDNEYCDWQKIHSRSYARALLASAKVKRRSVLTASVGWRQRDKGHPARGGGRGGGGSRSSTRR